MWFHIFEKLKPEERERDRPRAIKRKGLEGYVPGGNCRELAMMVTLAPCSSHGHTLLVRGHPLKRKRILSHSTDLIGQTSGKKKMNSKKIEKRNTHTCHLHHWSKSPIREREIT